MNFEKQRREKDCGVCCLAMVTGHRYEDIQRDLREWFRPGLPMDIIERYAGELGFAYLRRRRLQLGFYTIEWPCEPFAPAHIALVMRSADDAGHFVAVSERGEVLNPANNGTIGWLSDFWRVESLTGFWQAMAKPARIG